MSDWFNGLLVHDCWSTLAGFDLWHFSLVVALLISLIGNFYRQKRAADVKFVKTTLTKASNKKSDSIRLCNDQRYPDLEKIPLHSLESHLLSTSKSMNSTMSNLHLHSVQLRNQLLTPQLEGLIGTSDGSKQELESFYTSIYGVCCENVVGRIKIPLGIAGPLLIDGQNYQIPLATLEGALVASINRGCKAVSTFGVTTKIIGSQGMTRAPIIKAPNILIASQLCEHFESPKNFPALAQIFNSTSAGGHLKLQSIQAKQVGRFAFLRFRATTGDAMGMNIISKGCEAVLAKVLDVSFKDCLLISLSGNFCTDKKPSAVNWIEGRGRSVVAETFIPDHVVRSVLHIEEPKTLVELSIAKNLIGSAVSGSIGGYNAHVANTVAAIFLACGQDLAQVVEASQAMTIIESDSYQDNSGLKVSLTIPCVEVGVIGGGTCLADQKICIDLMTTSMNDFDDSCGKVDRLARNLVAAALAGEVSLLAALKTGSLVSSHMSLNRKK